MNKNLVLKEMQSIAKEAGYDLTLAECEDFLKIMESTYATVGEKLEPGENANVGCIRVEKKETKERRGTSELNGKITEWVKPPSILIDLKAKASFKKEHITEI